MRIKKTNIISLLFLFLFQNLVFSQSKPIVFLEKTDSISLYKNAQIAYSSSIDFKKCLPKLTFNSFEKNFEIVTPIPDTLQYAILHFSIDNHLQNDEVCYLKSKEDISFLKVFKEQDSNYIFVGGTGYAYRFYDLSVPKDETRVLLNLKKNSINTFVAYVKKYKYKLTIPELQIENKTDYLNNIEKKNNLSVDFYTLFTTIIAGFQLALLIYGLSKFVFHNQKKIYFFFSLICLMLILFYLSEINILVFEIKELPFITNNMVYEALGDLYIIVFNFLIISFLDIEKNQFLYKFLTRINLFWIALFFVEAIPFVKKPSIIIVFRFILNTAAIVDFITLCFIFQYCFKNRIGYRKYLFIGIFIMLISSFEIALPRFLNLIHLNPNWIKISKPSYFLLQICDNINFCFLFIAFIIREKEINDDKEKLEIEHKNVQDELIKTKKLVVNESIVLKDKTKINLDKLLYIEADDHYLNIHTIDGKKHFVRGRLSDILCQLPPNFIKCHRSYIVNKNFIKKAQIKFIIVIDNTKIPISRGFKI